MRLQALRSCKVCVDLWGRAATLLLCYHCGFGLSLSRLSGPELSETPSPLGTSSDLITLSFEGNGKPSITRLGEQSLRIFPSWYEQGSQLSL